MMSKKCSQGSIFKGIRLASKFKITLNSVFTAVDLYERYNPLMARISGDILAAVDR